MTEWSYPDISIHVPLAGDDGQAERRHGGSGISIHVPLAGDDDGQTVLSPELGELFQSTSPLRGTTIAAVVVLRHVDISIHVPLAGDD